MKNLLLIFILSLPVFSFAQNKIVLKDSTEFMAVVDGLYQKTLVFEDDIKALGGEDRIGIELVYSIIGKTPNYRKKAILKKNPDVIFVDAEYTKQDVKKYAYGTQNIPSDGLTAGDHLFRAGNRYLTGLGVSIVGAAMTGYGISEEDDSISIAGGVTALAGFIIGVTGHIELQKAGKKMNSDAITLSGASQGIGLAINF